MFEQTASENVAPTETLINSRKGSVQMLNHNDANSLMGSIVTKDGVDNE